MIITIDDIRRCNHCAKGIRIFFKQYNWDYLDFFNNGMPVEEFSKAEHPYITEIIEKAIEARGLENE